MRSFLFVGFLLVVIATLAGCESMHQSKDFDRHTHSQISTPLEGGDFMWFDVKLTPELPDKSDAAEAIRMQWLESWLKQRNTCLNGYTVLERREFGFLEHNPARFDRRYKISCNAPPLQEAT